MTIDAGKRALAPAKLNLYLHIVGRRADGYHCIDSLIAFAEAGDVVEVTPAPDGRLTLDVGGRFADALPDDPDDNLVLRAATRLRTATGTRAGAAIRLTKSLPVAAGIGGGSADAAAVLRALAGLWRVDDADPAPIAIAHGLGADVPVCLDGRTSRVAGIGADLVAHPALPPAALVLANPGVPVATAEVFRAFAAAGAGRPPGDAASDAWDDIADAAALAARLGESRNDLEAPAMALAPEIGTTLAALRALPGCLLARMSGSGATCFALFADDTAATAAAHGLAAAHPGWWVTATRLRTAPAATDRERRPKR